MEQVGSFLTLTRHLFMKLNHICLFPFIRKLTFLNTRLSAKVRKLSLKILK